ncbi:mutator type transposase [Tanacetum coccineum]
MQKGIVLAINTSFPSVEYRFCLKHIYDNMKLVWRGQLYKECLWKCATSTTIQYFDKNIDELMDTCKDAYEWLKKIPAVHCRAHCDVLLNNMCEVIAKCDGPLTPNATKLFNVIKKKAAQYKVEWNRDDKYQVTGPTGDQCVVTMSIKVCTCRRWELIGIPYKHAMAAINDMGNNGMVTCMPETWAHSSYWLRTWKQMYSFKINPVNGKQYWPKSFVPIELIPPKHHPQVGRTPKKRKKSAMEVEEMMKHGKLTRAGKTVRCLLCKQLGHNRRSYKGQTMEPRTNPGNKKRKTAA